MAQTEGWPEPSPFVYDGPIPPEQLIGRNQETRTLREWASAGRFTALIAPRRYGKTSLIGRVAVEAERHDDTAVVVADLFEVAGLADLVIRLERAWARHTPDRLRSAVSRVLAGARVGLSLGGAGFAVTLADRPQTDPLPALHTLLDLPTKLAGQHRHGRVLVVLDEFQSLGRVAGAEALLRSYAQHQRECASYLFAGSEPGMLAAAFGDSSRPFYGQAETFRLGRLPAAELAEAIDDRFARTDRHPGDVLPELVATSEGHPQRAMLLAHLLWSQTPSGQVSGAPEWERALGQAVRRVDAEAHAVFAGLRAGERKALRVIAEYGTPLSSRGLRTLDLVKSTAHSASAKLVAEGLVEQDPDENWRLVDPLLARWIRQQMPTRAPL